MIVLDVDNIHLPSVNRKYGYSPKSNRFVLAPEYRQMSNMITALMFENVKGVKMEAPYSVRIYLETYLDIDNTIKSSIDSLAKVGVIDNDKNILHLEVYKKPRKKGGGSRIKVEVNTWIQ